MGHQLLCVLAQQWNLFFENMTHLNDEEMNCDEHTKYISYAKSCLLQRTSLFNVHLLALKPYKGKLKIHLCVKTLEYPIKIIQCMCVWLLNYLSLIIQAK